MIEPERFETLPLMLCVGLRRQHPYADAQSTVQRQWTDFAALGDIPGARSPVVYGIMCGASASEFEYMCGVEVERFEDAPPQLRRIRIPAQEYAVFRHRGPSGTLAQTWLAVWQEWLPRSGFEMANTPEFERYAHGFATDTTDPGIEIWASIRRP